MSWKMGTSFASLLVFFLLWGCVSGTMRHVSMNNELPSDMPKDVQDKFEIKDLSQDGRNPSALVSPSPNPLGADEKGKKGKSKKKKGGEVAAASPTNNYANRRIAGDSIWVGEKLTYSISYFGVSAGDLILEVLPFKTMDNRKVYHIRATAISSPVFSLFYRLNDVIESFLDYNGLFSHRFHVVLDETKQTRDSLELHDYEKNQTFYWNRWNRKDAGYIETKEYAPILPYSQDSLSALYYVRTVPLALGAVFSAPVISEGKYFEAVCTVIRREKISTPMGRIQAFVVKPEMKYQGILKKSGDSFLWVSDDDRRIPIRLEAKVKIGTVVASLRAVSQGTPPTQEVSQANPEPAPTH